MARISCNRETRYGNRKPLSIRKVSSVSCGCNWVIRFKFLNSKKCNLSDSVKIIQICGFHTTTYYSSFVDQYIVHRTKVGEYTKCTDSILQKIMHEMFIYQELSVRTIISLLKKNVPSRR